MNNKKWIVITLIVLVVALFVTVFVACDKKKTCEHEWSEYTVAKAATCSAEGAKTRTCSKCGQTETEVIPVDANAHDWGDWTVTKAPTTDAKGEETRICKHNSTHVEKRDVDALPQGNGGDNANTGDPTHVHSYTLQVANGDYLSTQATCKAKATYFYSCSCGEKGQATFEYGDLADHNDVLNEDTSTAAACGSCGERHLICSVCGREKVEVLDALPHAWSAWSTVPATCTEKGSKTRSCNLCGTTVVIEIDAYGHNWNVDAATCETDKVCSTCGTVAEKKLSHAYQKVEDESFLPTCGVDGQDVYECSLCHGRYTDTIEKTGLHTPGEWIAGEYERVSETSCDYVRTSTSTCTACGTALAKEEHVQKHTYSIAITTVALCNQAGVKTLTCKDCGDEVTETYEDADAHDWNDGAEDGNITTYTCNRCSATKTTMNHKTSTSAEVAAADLKEAGSIELQEAAITFDEDAKGVLTGDVSISAEATKVEDLDAAINTAGLDPDKKVYDINMTVGGDDVHILNGTVTVCVPYELAEGENPENVAILYLNGDEIEKIPARYSNGFAYFETTHFSYYTVTLLTPAERCELYGHVYIEKITQPTCTLDGYLYRLCKRCGGTWIEVPDELKATGHDLSTEETVATCTTDGVTKVSCSKCSYKYTTVIPATGHNYEEIVELRKTPICTRGGENHYKCANCADEYVTTLPPAPHDFTAVTVDADCTTGGYTTHTCRTCAYTYQDRETKPLGHKYEDTVVAKTCTTDGYTTHKCVRCDASYRDAVIPAGHVWDIATPTCGRGQICTVCQAAGAPATGNHTIVNGTCTVCGQGCEHTWTEVVIAPTCVDGGYTRRVCSKCSYEERVNETSATGVHTYQDGVCSVCGAVDASGSYYLNVLKNLLHQPLRLHIDEAEMSSAWFYDGEYREGGYYIKDTDLWLVKNENGTFDGKVRGCIGYYDNVGDVDAAAYDNVGIVRDNVVYLEYESKTYACVPLNDYLKGVMSMFDLYEYVDVGASVLSMITEEIEPAIDDMPNALRKEVYDAIDKCLAECFTKEIEGRESVLTLDFRKLIEIAEDLRTMSFKEAVDGAFGEGTYDSWFDVIDGFYDMTMEEALVRLEENGLDVDDLVRIAFVFLEKGSKIQDVSEEYQEVLADFLEDLQELFPEGNGETAEAYLHDLMKQPDFRRRLVSDVLVDTKIASPDDIEKLRSKLATFYADFGEISLVEHASWIDIPLDDILEEGVTEFLPIFRDYATISFRTAEDGKILSGILAFDMNEDGDRFYLDALLDAEEDIRVDEGLIDLVLSYALTRADLDAILANNDDAEAILDDAGEPIGFSYTTKSVVFTSLIVPDDYYDFYYFRTDMPKGTVKIEEVQCVTTKVLLAGNYYFWYNCNGDRIYQLFGELDNDYFEYVYYDANGAELKRSPSDTKLYLYEDIHYVALKYDAAEERYVLGGDFYEEDHEFVEDTSRGVTPERCGEDGVRYLVCKKCGDERVVYYKKAHEAEAVYTFADPEHPDCEDGVTLTVTCTACREKLYERKGNDHYNFRHSVDLSAFDACEEHDFLDDVMVCVCGKEYTYNFNESPFYNSRAPQTWYGMTLVEEEEDARVYRCDKCGLTATFSEDYEDRNEEHPCTSYNVYTLEITQGELSERFVRKYVDRTMHDSEDTATLLPGSVSCTDGVLVTETCRRCGYTHEYTTTSHKTVQKRISLPALGEGYYFDVYICACGERLDASDYYPLYRDGQTVDWDGYGYAIDNNWAIYERLRFLIRMEERAVEGDPCKKDVYAIMRYGYDGSSYASEEEMYLGRKNAHTYLCYVDSDDDLENCWDHRITVTYRCVLCGAEYSDFVYYGTGSHLTCVTDVIDLDETGNVKMYIMGCPCGTKEKSVACVVENGKIAEGYHNNGMYVCTLSDQKIRATFTYSEPVGCISEATLHLRYGYDPDSNNFAFDKEVSVGSVKRHNYFTFVELLDEDGESCTDGVRYESRCIYCGNVEYSGATRNHREGVVDTLSLEDGAMILISGCACGQYKQSYSMPEGFFSSYVGIIGYDPYTGSYVTQLSYPGYSVFDGSDILSGEEIAIDGVRWMVYSLANSRVLVRLETTAPVNCSSEVRLIVRIGYDVESGNYQREEIRTLGTIDNHDAQVRYELQEGATDCNDQQVRAVVYCAVCGEELRSGTSWRQSYHEYKNLVETIDLTPYGSTCGAVAKLYTCPCGKVSEVRFETDAEFTRTDLPKFYDSRKDYWYQYLYSCPVTDPEPCGFRYAVRYREDVNGCEHKIVRYYILGCDENGDATAGSRTIDVVVDYVFTVHLALSHSDGEYSAWAAALPCVKRATRTESCSACGYTNSYYVYLSEHTYAEVDYDVPFGAGKGMTLHADAGNYCSVCRFGSYRIMGANGECIESYRMEESAQGWYYDQRIYCKDEFYGFTTVLINGATVYRYYYSQFGMINAQLIEQIGAASYDLTTAKADLLAMLNDPDQACWSIQLRIDEEGELSLIRVEDACRFRWSYSTTIEPTCTQYGLGGEIYYCLFCGRVESSSDDRTILPLGHDFVYDEEKECYVCSRCGIENAVGVNGGVTLEDCTDYEENADICVVGYYDPTGRDFTLMISLINKENHDDQLVILDHDVPMTVTGLGFDGKPVYRYLNEGHYIGFSRSEVLAIAAEEYPEADLKDYDIRLSFVPVGAGDGDLDYGITFGDL